MLDVSSFNPFSAAICQDEGRAHSALALALVIIYPLRAC